MYIYYLLKNIIGIYFKSAIGCLTFFYALEAKPQQQHYKKFTITRSDKKSAVISFELINNLMVIPVSINHSDTMRFIVDTGASTTLITSLLGIENFDLKYTRHIKIQGLGLGEPIQALVSVNNYIDLHHAQGKQLDLIALPDDILNLSANLGVPIHGLIGYDLFRSFVVEIDYVNSKIRLHKPKSYKRPKIKKNRFAIPLMVENSKPYVYAKICGNRQEKIKVKLLIDSGASHAMSLFSDTHEHIDIPEASFPSFLGVGLSGDIHGYIGLLECFEIGSSRLAAPIASFPNKEAITTILNQNKSRNGSLGGEILKRYRVIFDYSRKEIILRPNRFFRKSFHHNMSGIEVITPVPGLNIYEVARVREGSSAEKAGIQVGDNIRTINGLSTLNMRFDEVVTLLQGKKNKDLRLLVARESIVQYIRFKVEDPIGQKRK